MGLSATLAALAHLFVAENRDFAVFSSRPPPALIPRYAAILKMVHIIIGIIAAPLALIGFTIWDIIPIPLRPLAILAILYS